MHRTSSLATIATLAALAVPGIANAKTLCVNDPAGCSGDAVAAADLENGALKGVWRSDGDPDKVVIGPGTYDGGADAIYVGGTDEIEIAGSGRDQTRLTSKSLANSFVLGFASVNFSKVHLRDLEVQVPEAFPNEAGGGIMGRAGTYERIRITSANPGSYGIVTNGELSTLRDVEIEAPGGTGVRVNAPTSVVSSTIRGEEGITNTSDTTSSFKVDRSTIEGGVGSKFGSAVTNRSAIVTVRNSVITLEAEATDGASQAVDTRSAKGLDATTSLEHVTVVNEGLKEWTTGLASNAAVGQDGKASTQARSSIVRGFGNDIHRTAGSAAGDGAAIVSLRHVNASSLDNEGIGNGSVERISVIDADPQFVPGTYRLAQGSSSIDAGDPVVAVSPQDRDGNPRRQDGNGDSTEIGDLGAYEHTFVPAVKVDDPPVLPVASVEPAKPRQADPQPPVALPLAATFGKPGKVEVLRRGATFLVRTGDAVSCRAGGPVCSLAVTAKVKRGKRLVTVGTLRAKVGAGKTTKVQLKLGKTGAKLLRSSKRLKVSLVLTAKQAGARDARAARSITARKPRR